jgi:folate-dependent phosphoribosylglycinamide formyltransferase PurN
MKKPWIAFFSQTGTEIVDLAESLGRWPDLIVTNQRPAGLRVINKKLKEADVLVTVSNRPSVSELEEVIGYYKDPIVTLHGWLRVMPPSICEKYTIFNGHPGLITEYPELKGKDPQIRAFEGKYPVIGCVLHRVTAGVDEGRVIAEERFNAYNITEEEMWKVTRDRSLYLWIQFLRLTLAL